MKWIEAIIETKAEAVEILSAVLLEAGVSGFQIEDDEETRRFLLENPENWDYLDDELKKPPRPGVFIKFYLDALAGNETLINIRQRLNELEGDLGRVEITAVEVDDEGWLDNWKKYYKPFKVGRNIVIRPVWEEYAPAGGELVFTINPGHLFGTGLHSSTRMCIALIEKHLRKGMGFADIGCGSGILSILALMLGAGSAMACDTEAAAGRVAYENAGLNGINIDNYTVETGNILTDAGLQRKFISRGFDFIAANIVSDVIIPLCPIAAEMSRPGTIFVVSGIIGERAAEVREALARNGFAVIEESAEDGWVAMAASKG